jgi:hypothetical protein
VPDKAPRWGQGLLWEDGFVTPQGSATASSAAARQGRRFAEFGSSTRIVIGCIWRVCHRMRSESEVESAYVATQPMLISPLKVHVNFTRSDASVTSISNCSSHSFCLIVATPPIAPSCFPDPSSTAPAVPILNTHHATSAC